MGLKKTFENGLTSVSSALEQRTFRPRTTMHGPPILPVDLTGTLLHDAELLTVGASMSDWKDISADNLLNYSQPETAVIARYERIMVHRATLEMRALSTQMSSLGAVLDVMSVSLSDKADRAFARYEDAAETQAKEQASLRAQLSGLGETIHKMHQGLKEKADELSRKYDDAAKAQARQQRAVTLLTWVIAGSTLAYSLVSILSAVAGFQANHIQKRLLKYQEYSTNLTQAHR